MKREIEFRGIKVHGGEWCRGYLVKDISYISDKRKKEKFFIGYLPTSLDEVISETVGQFTGLKDKNGKMIFEGDKLESHYNKKIRDIVEYETDSSIEVGVAGFVIPFLENAEIIGTIHDHLIKSNGQE